MDFVRGFVKSILPHLPEAFVQTFEDVLFQWPGPIDQLNMVDDKNSAGDHQVARHQRTLVCGGLPPCAYCITFHGILSNTHTVAQNQKLANNGRSQLVPKWLCWNIRTGGEIWAVRLCGPNLYPMVPVKA